MSIEPYNHDRDKAAALRIWHECGWADATSEHDAKLLDRWVAFQRSWVGRLNGDVECMVQAADATVQHLDEPLPLAGITAVTVSRVARKQRLASRVTAHAIAHEARAGKLVAALGIFDQGYYDRLGFGTGAYEHELRFDPRTLRVPLPKRPPVRLGLDDFEELHRCRVDRAKQHGYVSLDHPGMTETHAMEKKSAYGLGFRDDNGTLTHYLYLKPAELEFGPDRVQHLVWSDRDQLLELLGVIKSFEDQVHMVCMIEPPGVQMQALLDEPHRRSEPSYGEGKWKKGILAGAWSQWRVLDVPGCLARTHLKCEPLRFNLSLIDPIQKHLGADSPWQGVGGDYVVTLGETSSAAPGANAALPTLSTTVNTFTRLWLGVCSATGLSITDGLQADGDLTHALDRAFAAVPTPRWDWSF